MKITNIRIRLIDDAKLVATASVELDNCFVVHDIKVIKGIKGLFVAMPSRKITDEYQDTCHPIDQETRDYFTKEILQKYEEVKLNADKDI